MVVGLRRTADVVSATCAGSYGGALQLALSAREGRTCGQHLPADTGIWRVVAGIRQFGPAIACADGASAINGRSDVPALGSSSSTEVIENKPYGAV